MLAKACTCAVDGLEGLLVEVEVDIGHGLPAFTIVGCPTRQEVGTCASQRHDERRHLPGAVAVEQRLQRWRRRLRPLLLARISSHTSPPTYTTSLIRPRRRV
jgi:hypothetical protein